MSTMDFGVGFCSAGPGVGMAGRGLAQLGLVRKATQGRAWFQLGQVGQLVLAWFQLGQVGQLGLAWWGQRQAGQLGFGSFWVGGAGKVGRAAWFGLGLACFGLVKQVLAWWGQGQAGQLGLAWWGQGQVGQLDFGLAGAGRAGLVSWFWLGPGQVKGRLGFSWAGAGQVGQAWFLGFGSAEAGLLTLAPTRCQICSSVFLSTESPMVYPRDQAAHGCDQPETGLDVDWDGFNVPERGKVVKPRFKHLVERNPVCIVVSLFVKEYQTRFGKRVGIQDG
ncbi:hypothetical protein BY996DRAFT_6443230 [Phakopsora pachyrhizi]|nr:hypothetical protein BY996DRAFT_6443230 [Phakopsora pachyrhizi]